MLGQLSVAGAFWDNELFADDVYAAQLVEHGHHGGLVICSKVDVSVAGYEG